MFCAHPLPDIVPETERENVMKVSNFTSSNGNKVANQFIIERFVNHGDANNLPMVTVKETVFQSYDSVIARRTSDPCGGDFVELDRVYWDYSKTTSKYRNQFLRETKKETEKKIASGEYVLTDLNGEINA